MSDGGIPIQWNGRVCEVAPGTPVGELVGARPGGPIVGATLNRHLVCLDTPLAHPVKVSAVEAASPPGTDIVRRTASTMLHAALHRHFPEVDFEVGQSFLGGYYYEVRIPSSLALEDLASSLTGHLQEMARQDVPFLRSVLPVEQARSVLSDADGSKARLLKTWPSPHVPIVRLDGYADIQHGPYVPSTGFVPGLQVLAWPPGLVLQFFPQAPGPESVRGVRLLAAYRETRDWNRHIGVSSVGDLNQAVLDDRVSEVIRVQEALHEKKIARLADEIAARRDQVRLVCIAGPSCSGKTTFVRRLSVQLQVNGLEPLVLELDDYYRDRADCPRDEEGNYDFECLEALDIPLLSAHLEDLAAGRETVVPKFDFSVGSRAPRDRWRTLRLQPHQVLLVEGIHGLNPALTRAVAPEAKFRIFVSALTQLVIDEHNRIGTSEVRLLRRIVRDRRYRGTGASGSISMWDSVRRGEERWIFPFQEHCEAMFNSALVYEAAVLKTFAWRYLLEVPREDESRTRAYSLLKFLELFVPVFPDQVPSNSVLREFIGGSGFSY